MVVLLRSNISTSCAGERQYNRNTIGGEETDERVKESEGKELGGLHETEVTKW